MLIMGTLFVMLFLVFFSLVLGGEFTQIETEVTIDNTALVNGTSETWEVEVGDTIFDIDPIVGAIIIITTIIVLATIVGIQILGSGLSESTIRIIVIGTSYAGLWIILSALTYTLIVSIEIFGTIIYMILTIVYVIGVVQKIAGGSD